MSILCPEQSYPEMARPVCLADFENYACQVLPKNALDYYRSGADGEITLSDNVKTFSRWKILPRVLNDVSTINLQTTILGHSITFPVCVAPTAMNKMAHPDGEMAAAKAAASMGIGYTLSTIATSSIEDIAACAPDGLRFFQLYIYKQKSLTRQLVARAERCGYKALILTVDTPFFGKRLADDRNKFKLPPHLKMANFEKLDFTGFGVNKAKDQSGLNEYASSLFDPSLTWADVEWLKSITKLPIVLKGILSAKDACLAAEKGVAGILVSNHGARQLDTVPATIDVLPSIVAAVAGRCEVYLDGGIRCGTDVFKALALGAKAIFIGRPVIYGLAYDGENGVKALLTILRDEFKATMALSGVSALEDINREMVISIHEIPSKL